MGNDKRFFFFGGEMNQPQKALTSRLSSVLAGTSQCIYSPFLFFFSCKVSMLIWKNSPVV